MNAAVAERRADELQERLRRRLEELAQEAPHHRPGLTAVIGGALVVPVGLVARLLDRTPTSRGPLQVEARRDGIVMAADAASLGTSEGKDRIRAATGAWLHRGAGTTVSAETVTDQERCRKP